MLLPIRDALRATTPATYRWSRHVGLIVAFAAAAFAIPLVDVLLGTRYAGAPPGAHRVR
jgi:hypothetical protein